ncbi:hypothetical protein RU97_GL000840 [Enterococcus canis]|uniref:DUF998 domain-containing protein n=1 Tax=Enterococcus canis TaxID=214095 RepID=A0A1L8RHM5_9ENTE|nr:hypothetical protein [Enterococcus canis]OJG19269.1 hypothetical protein RU97_GL000840 [Enterococcus canis]
METVKRIHAAHWRYAGFSGILALILLLCHLFFESHLMTISPLTHVLSDLDPVRFGRPNSPTLLAKAYGVVATLFSINFYFYFRESMPGLFRDGARLFAIMQVLVFIVLGLTEFNHGYLLLDVLYMLITGCVVLLATTAFFLFTCASLDRSFGWFGKFAAIGLAGMIIGTLLTILAPLTSLVFAEQINLFTVIIFNAIMGVFQLTYPIEKEMC